MPCRRSPWVLWSDGSGDDYTRGQQCQAFMDGYYMGGSHGVPWPPSRAEAYQAYIDYCPGKPKADEGDNDGDNKQQISTLDGNSSASSAYIVQQGSVVK